MHFYAWNKMFYYCINNFPRLFWGFGRGNKFCLFPKNNRILLFWSHHFYFNKKSKSFLTIYFYKWKKNSLAEKVFVVENKRTQRNLFEIYLNQTEIRLYLPFSDWFGTANGRPFGTKWIGRWFWLISAKSEKVPLRKITALRGRLQMHVCGS